MVLGLYLVGERGYWLSKVFKFYQKIANFENTLGSESGNDSEWKEVLTQKLVVGVKLVATSTSKQKNQSKLC